MKLLKGKLKNDFFSDVTEIPEVFNKSHFPSLDGFRAISIMVVIAAHVLMSFKTGYYFDFFAYAGVQFFFVISGFLITTLLLKEKISKVSINLKNFYIRRFFRIIPVAYLYLFIILALNIVFKLHIKFLYIITPFLFIRNFYNGANGADHLTTHYWSLAIEEQFYLIFPFMLKKSLRLYLYILLGILLFSLVINLVALAMHTMFTEYPIISFIINFINQFQGIAIGSLLSILIFKNKIAINSISVYLQIALLAGIILLIMYPSNFEGIQDFFKCAFFGIILIANLDVRDNAFFRFLNKSWIKTIGVLSYSMYIWQQPFTQGLNFINSSRLLKSMNNKLPADIGIVIVSLIMLGVVSYVSYNFYEKRFLKFKKRFN